MLAIGTLLTLAVSAIQLEQGTAAAGCDLRPLMDAAMTRVLHIESGPPAPLGADDLRVRIEEVSPSRVRVRFLGLGGELLVRELDADRTACMAVAETIALILERYLADLGWAPDSPLPLPIGRAPVQTPTAPAPPVSPPAVAPAAADDGAAVEAGAEATAVARAAGSFGLGAEVGFCLRVGPWLVALVGGAQRLLPVPIRQDGERRGEVAVQILEARLRGGRCAAIAGGDACVEAFAAAERISAAASGAGIYAAARLSSSRPAIGAALSWGYAVRPWLQARLQLAGEWRPFGPQLVIEGARDVEPIAPWEARLGAGVAIPFF